MRVWFLDDATKMNPHLKYAQAVPGRNVGRGAGIIETHDLPELVDAIGLLNSSKSWTQIEHERLRDWFRAYLNWLIDSPEGKAESNATNNHGSWFDVQVACYALFVGRDELARKILAEFTSKRIAKQIEPDGGQSQELTSARERGTIQFSIWKHCSTLRLSRTSLESICGDTRHRTNAAFAQRWIG